MPADKLPFNPGKGPKFEAFMAAARKMNEQRDKADRDAGNKAPEDHNLTVHLRTVIQAITTGIEVASWACVAEGLDMPQKAEIRSR